MNNNLLKRRSESGVVLIVVLIVVAILTTLVVDLIYFTQINTEITANSRDAMKAQYIAKSGVYIVAGTIKNESLENLTSIAGVLGDQNGNSEGYWTITIPSLPVGDGIASVGVVDERSKVNLNALVNQITNQVDRQVLVELTELFRMAGVDNGKSSRFISSLINWLDHPISGQQNNDQDPNGAKAEFYAKLPNPYQIKDGPLDSVEEIRLINGMDDEFFNEIKDYVTVYPTDKKINFSTAPKIVMMAALKGASVSVSQRQGSASQEDLKDDIAESIAGAVIDARKENSVIDQRKVREIVQKENVNPSVPISAGLSGVVLSGGTSDVFSITSRGSLGQVNTMTRNIIAVVRKITSQNSHGVNIISWKEQ
jgi:general secretion pathway protein K